MYTWADKLAPGVKRSWTRLLDGHCGVVSLKDKGDAFLQQQCQVAGLVPQGRKEDGAWRASDWKRDGRPSSCSTPSPLPMKHWKMRTGIQKAKKNKR
ncbi:MAG: hypothetical protein Q9207_004792 [Kuettlingeria erythrocarpa]